MSIEAMKQMVEALEIAAEGGGVDFYAYAKEGRQAIAEASQNGLYCEGYRNGYAFGEAAGKRQAIAEAEKQEPVAWQWLTTAHFRKKLPKDAEKGAWNPLYTTPQQRKPLTDEDIRKAKHHMVDGAYQYSFMQGVRYAEAAHGIKE